MRITFRADAMTIGMCPREIVVEVAGRCFAGRGNTWEEARVALRLEIEGHRSLLSKVLDAVDISEPPHSLPQD